MNSFEALRFASLPVSPVALRSRVVYQTAFAQARSVLEIDGDGAAAREVRELFGHVWRQLNGEGRAPMRSANDDLGGARSRAGLNLLPIA